MEVHPTGAFRLAHWTGIILISEPSLFINIAQPSGIIKIQLPLKINPPSSIQDSDSQTVLAFIQNVIFLLYLNL